MKIRLTKLKQIGDSNFSLTSYQIPDVGSVWEGEPSSATPHPKVGSIFILCNDKIVYRTSMIREIISENTFRTLNSIYRWELLPMVEELVEYLKKAKKDNWTLDLGSLANQYNLTVPQVRQIVDEIYLGK